MCVHSALSLGCSALRRNGQGPHHPSSWKKKKAFHVCPSSSSMTGDIGFKVGRVESVGVVLITAVEIQKGIQETVIWRRECIACSKQGREHVY